MRVKIFFLRKREVGNSIPLHHQKLVYTAFKEIMDETSVKSDFYNFSSLKGTSKIQNGFMRFLSFKITLVVSSSNDSFVKQWVKNLFEKSSIQIGKLVLTPKTYQLIPEPVFETQMKYVCISPIILTDPDKEPDLSQKIIDPLSHEFSDLLYHAVTENMEKAGFSDQELNSFAEFEAMPDQEYVNKILQTGKKYARIYKNNAGSTMIGYLLPFTLHAHPTVHKFIWDCGMGVFTQEGYGMIDVATPSGIREGEEDINIQAYLSG